MVTGVRLYRYVGPPHLLTAVPPNGTGHRITTAENLPSWAASVDEADRAEPHTFVVDSDGVLRLAPRRSEHVSCAVAAPCSVLASSRSSATRTVGRSPT